MAEPLTIIGLASNIISFVDFGFKLVSEAKNVRDSLHGTTPEINELEQTLARVQRLSAQLQSEAVTGPQQLSQDEKDILGTVNECNALAKDIAKRTKNLKVRDNARFKLLEYGKVALSEIFHTKEIEDLRRRLDKVEQRLRFNICNALDGKRHSVVLAKLTDMEKSRKELNINYESMVDRVRTEIVSLASQSEGGMRDATHSAELTSLKTKLDYLEKEHAVCSRQARVIRSLYFKDLSSRRAQITEAESATNSWLFDTTLTPFTTWLESSQSSIFWISGKAGSGKSTLMKFAANHENTKRALETWAGSSPLYTAGFYFWNQGSEMQKSQLGLFQSLLYQILRQAPIFIPLVCSDRLDHEVWDLGELKKTFERIATQERLDAKFCFFIDGLDEYDGVEEEVVQMLRFLSSSSHIKICASSRPRPIFEEFITDENNKIVIHEFTREDMKQFVRQRLYDNQKFQLLKSSDPACEEIVAFISDQAKGVWLWVFFVTRDLLHAVNRNEGLHILQRIVRQFPTDLETYFERIIRRIRAEYQEEMAKMFLIMLDSLDQDHPIPLDAFWLLEKESSDPDYVLKVPVPDKTTHDSSKEMAEWTCHYSLETWKYRLQNRCGDLLVAEKKAQYLGTPTLFPYRVDFLHRTVHDFMQDCYYERLKMIVPKFCSMAFCTRMCVYLTKLQAHHPPPPSWGIPNHLVDFSILHYAFKAENKVESPQSPVTDILDEFEKVTCRYPARYFRDISRWTKGPQLDLASFEEDEFLAVAICAELLKYVRTKLRQNPRNRSRIGKPLIDYALRPWMVCGYDHPTWPHKHSYAINLNMVRLLLRHHADPNMCSNSIEGRTAWGSFLRSCLMLRFDPNVSWFAIDSWYGACELLIEHGARSDCLDAGKQRAAEVLQHLFGDRHLNLLRMMEENESKRPESQCVVA